MTDTLDTDTADERNPVPANLRDHTFTTETARLAGKKSAEARRAKRAIAEREAKTLAQQLDSVRTAFGRGELGPAASAVAGYVMSLVVTDNVKIRHGEDAAALLRVLVDIARLEAGQATSHTMHATIDGGDAVARVRKLQAQARETLATSAELVESATAQAADDETPVVDADVVEEGADAVSPEPADDDEANTPTDA